MDRCPNCGSTIRIGAKFCTSCGFRLPDQPEDASPSAPSRSPFATTTASSEKARSAWDASSWAPSTASAPTPDPLASESAPVAAYVSPTDAPEHQGDAQEPAPDLVEAADAEPMPEHPESDSPEPEVHRAEPESGGWPGMPASDWNTLATAGGLPSAAQEEPDATDSPLDDDIVAAFAHPGSASVATAEPVSADQPESADAPMVADSEEQVTDATFVEIDSPDAVDSRLTAQNVGDGDNVGDEDLWPSFDESDAPGQLPAADVSADPTSAMPVVTEPASTSAVIADSASPTASGADAQARAHLLLDELRTLIGEMTVAAPSGELPESNIADSLAAVRAESPGEATVIDDLRATIASAQSRPRDVDVMLGLVGQADGLASLLAAHDRYRDAIDTALEALRATPE